MEESPRLRYQIGQGQRRRKHPLKSVLVWVGPSDAHPPIWNAFTAAIPCTTRGSGEVGRKLSRELHNHCTVAPNSAQLSGMLFLQTNERNGGDDETRTRDLCRDSEA